MKERVKTIRISPKEYYKTGLLCMLAAVALIVGFRTVRVDTYQNPYVPKAAVAAPTEQPLSIPVMVFSEEEADSLLAKIEEERKAAEAAAAAAKKAKREESDNYEYSGSDYYYAGEDDAYYIAAAVCREAGGENTEIMMLVANVIMNRVTSPHFPNTVYGVLTQKYQYGTMWIYGISFPSWADEGIRNRCYSVAYRILSGERVCPSGVVYQAEFEQGSGIYEWYPGFYFCYE